jgi:hypothetical protein
MINTRQLRAILDVLDRANRPVSVEEIFSSAKMSEPGLGVACSDLVACSTPRRVWGICAGWFHVVSN